MNDRLIVAPCVVSCCATNNEGMLKNSCCCFHETITEYVYPKLGKIKKVLNHKNLVVFSNTKIYPFLPVQWNPLHI